MNKYSIPFIHDVRYTNMDVELMTAFWLINDNEPLLDKGTVVKARQLAQIMIMAEKAGHEIDPHVMVRICSDYRDPCNRMDVVFEKDQIISIGQMLDTLYGLFKVWLDELANSLLLR